MAEKSRTLKRPAKTPERAWQRMLSGRRLDLLDPSPVDIEIVDIAHGLARVARWNGQTKGAHAFSVAQHCLLVADIAKASRAKLDRRWELASLLHDSAEYVVGDLISPFKAAVGIDYKGFELRLLAVIHIRFGLPAKLPEDISKLIKRADRVAAFFEATQLAGFSHAEAKTYFGLPGPLRPRVDDAAADHSGREEVPGSLCVAETGRGSGGFPALPLHACTLGSPFMAQQPRPSEQSAENFVSVGLTAAIVATIDDMPCALEVEHQSGERRVSGETDFARTGLPFGPFDPHEHRTLESGLRMWVEEQTKLQLGYVEQLYTFGDRGRHDQDPDGGLRVLSVGYLALTRRGEGERVPGTIWRSWYEHFPWEDFRRGRPELIDEHIAPALDGWLKSAGRAIERRRERVRQCFGFYDGPVWDEERVLERYELLYEAGLIYESLRDRPKSSRGMDAADPRLGLPMIYDHRRILATAMGRLRAKLKYRPVIFELMPPTFTLFDLQRTVEAISGVRIHKQNFRRLVETGGLVEQTGATIQTRGRPAQLFRFRREVLGERPAPGVRLTSPRHTRGK